MPLVISNLSLLILLALFAGSLRAAEPATGDARIEALISRVEVMKDVKFIRNGTAYDPGNAAKFLRGKWQARKKEIRKPAEFIEKVATRSSTTGKPYLIRSKDGSEKPCGPYLTEELKQIEAGSPP